MPKPFNPFGKLEPQQFLREYWQKRPLLVRGSFTDMPCPIIAEELAGLACEADIESRLIECPEHIEAPWPVQHGPFDETDFAALPESNWTLLVQDVDKWVPALKDLIEPFRFIPDWRIDDVMISYAEDGGTVGPHWDDYDVFLIQGAGRREWRIDERAISPDNLLPNQALRLMKDFQTSQRWILEPGDMLYLPPRLAHYGTALGGGCMTCSLGFRAPDQAGLVEEFTHALLSDLACAEPGPSRYSDPDLTPSEAPGEIHPAALSRLIDLTRDTLLEGLNHPSHHPTWLGEFLTRPKPGLEIPVPDAPWTSKDLSGTDAPLLRDGRSRLSWNRAEDRIQVYINGESATFDAVILPLLKGICARFQYDVTTLTPYLKEHPENTRLLDLLMTEGHLYFDE